MLLSGRFMELIIISLEKVAGEKSDEGRMRWRLERVEKRSCESHSKRRSSDDTHCDDDDDCLTVTIWCSRLLASEKINPKALW